VRVHGRFGGGLRSAGETFPSLAHTDESRSWSTCRLLANCGDSALNSFTARRSWKADLWEVTSRSGPESQKARLTL
jgi:hypothetical protein